MRLIKKATKNMDVVDRYQLSSRGISRLPGGWQVRIGSIDKKPVFKKYYSDVKSGCRMQALRKALDDRDEQINIQGITYSRRKPYIDENGKLKGLTLSKQKSYYVWQVFYTDISGKQKGKIFGFYKDQKVIRSFIRAVMFLKSMDKKINGSSEIDTNMVSIHSYLNAYIKSLDKSSHKFRSLRLFL